MIFLIKVVTSVIIIVGLTELTKKLPVLSGLIASMPLVTVIILIWIYVENQNPSVMKSFVNSVLWGLVPTFLFFVAMAILLKKHLSFPLALVLSYLVWGIGVLVHQLWIKE
jgi:uncharacterized membrane protein (GlpM family)